jgi:hypothetical protein
MAGAAAGRDRHLALNGRVRPHDDMRPGPTQAIRVGGQDPVQHLVHEAGRFVEDLLHGWDSLRFGRATL